MLTATCMDCGKQICDQKSSFGQNKLICSREIKLRVGIPFGIHRAVFN